MMKGGAKHDAQHMHVTYMFVLLMLLFDFETIKEGRKEGY
jgi:hypothetical protein